MKIKLFLDQMKQKKIDAVKNTDYALLQIEKSNAEFFHFTNISSDLAKKQAGQLKSKTDKLPEVPVYLGKRKEPGKIFSERRESADRQWKDLPLAGILFSFKDAICIKDVETRAGSAILNGYKPVFNATVVNKVVRAGGIVVGHTAQDEFGFGSFCANVGKGFNVPLNPLNKLRCTGGSSGGAAASVKALDLPYVAVAESTGGSITAPASFCGVAGLTPTYGRISRHGLIDYATSLDKIGLMAQNVDDIAIALDQVAGYDKKDMTSASVPVKNCTSLLRKDIRRCRVAVVSNFMQDHSVKDYVKDAVNDALGRLDDFGLHYDSVELPYTLKYGIPAYYIAAVAEASTNLAKFSGMRYGVQENISGTFSEYYSKIRSAQFSDEAKRRILIGTFARMAGFRDAYYLKALKIRTKIIQEYKQIFKNYDCIITPSMPCIAPKFSKIDELDPLEMYQMDLMTVGPNFAGLPHMSVNVGYHKSMPVGMTIVADHFNEETVLQVGNASHIV